MRNKCGDGKDCCADGLVCAPQGRKGIARCVAPDPEGDLYTVGDYCNSHKQCTTKYCDKKGYWGPRWQCSSASTKRVGDGFEESEDEVDNTPDSSSFSGNLAIGLGTVLAVAAAVAVVATVNAHRSTSVSVSTSQGTRSVISSEEALTFMRVELPVPDDGSAPLPL